MKNIVFENTGFKNFYGEVPRKRDGSKCEFGKINLIFGENGSGKSTFTEYLNKEYDNCIVFNKNYVKENILLQEENLFKGIKMISGSDNIIYEKRINELKKKESILTEQKVIIKSEIDLKNKEMEKLIKNLNESNKNGTKIRNVTSLGEAEKILNKNKIDYSKYDINKLTLYSEHDGLEYMPKLNYQLLEEVQKCIETEYIEKNFSFNDYKWILNGKQKLEKDKCAFCGSNVSPEKIKEIDEFLKDATSKAKRILIQEIQIITELLNINFSKINKGHKFITDELEMLKDKILSSNIRFELKKLKMFIETKITNMSKISNEFGNLNNLIDEFNTQLIDQYNNKIDVLQKRLKAEATKKNDIVKLLICDKIRNNPLLVNISKESEKLFSEISKIDDEMLQNSNEIKILKDKQTSLDKFKDYFNLALKRLNKHFYLDIQNKHYILRSEEMDEVRLTDLSEGESFLFAFLYFYYENLLEYSSSPKLVLIDDPFSSLDTQNKYYIEGMILRFVNDNIKIFDKDYDYQLFIFTHHYGFYVDLLSSMSKSQCKNYVLENKQKQKIIVSGGKGIKEYKSLYNSVIEFADDPIEEKSIHVANAMRRCVETFCKFNFNISGVSNVEIYHEYFIRNLYDLPEVQSFLKFINGLSHGIEDEFACSTVERYSQMFKDIFEKNFPTHHEAMIENQ